jgi:hypothetical protein
LILVYFRVQKSVLKSSAGGFLLFLHGSIIVSSVLLRNEKLLPSSGLNKEQKIGFNSFESVTDNSR